MAMGHDNSDGSDTFWPGYVDAVTNLVLNLLFLLTIMIVAVFMFALELGRSSKGGADKSLNASSKRGDVVNSKTVKDPVTENIELKREVEQLKMQLAQQRVVKSQPVVVGKTVDATSPAAMTQNRLEKVIATSDSEVIVRFSEEAVAFTPAEHDKLIEVLKPVMAKGKAGILVEVPGGFSEAKRMGFYRAMAVRNLLIEMKMPRDSIDVSVLEVKRNGNAAVVRVKSR